jgi:hypothetical protein
MSDENKEKKTAADKSTAAAKKPASSKSTASKTTGTKSTASKTAASKKPAAAKAPAKKAATSKSTAAKAAPEKTSAAKTKTAAAKTTAKKPAAKKAPAKTATLAQQVKSEQDKMKSAGSIVENEDVADKKISSDNTDKALEKKKAEKTKDPALTKDEKALKKAEKKAENDAFKASNKAAKEKYLKESADRKKAFDESVKLLTKAEAEREKRKFDLKEKEFKDQYKLDTAKRVSPERKKKRKIAKIFTSVIAILLLLAWFLCWFFGVFLRTSTAVSVADGSKVSVAEYEYYYRSMYNYYYTMSKQYEEYYSSYYGTGAGKMFTGFDSTLSPENQEYTSSTLDSKYGDNPTWADYFESTAIDTSRIYTALWEMAKDKGYTLTKTEQSEIDSYVKQLRETAADDDYSLDAYLRNQYGKGMTENLLRKIYEKQTLASDYLDDVKSGYSDAVTTAQIQAIYDKTPYEYNNVSYKVYSFTSDAAENTDSTSYTDAELKTMTEQNNTDTEAKAQTMLDAITDSASFDTLAYNNSADDVKEYYKDSTYTLMSGYDYSTIKSALNATAAKWITSTDRKTGDKKMFTISNSSTGTVSCYVVYIETPGARDDTLQPVNVRSILFAVSDDTTSTTSSSSKTHTDAQAKALAEKYYAKWKSGKATEATFKSYASKYSEDSNTSDNGGLIEDIYKTGNTTTYDQNLINWCYTSGRKAGDSGIIQTSSGYQILYCTKVSKLTKWQATIRDSIVEEKYEAFYNKINDSKEYKATSKDKRIAKVRSRCEEYAAAVIANDKSSSTSTTTTTAASKKSTTTTTTATTTAASSTTTTTAAK